MNLYVLLAAISALVLYQLIILVFGKKRTEIGYIITSSILIGFVYFFFFDSLVSTYGQYYQYGTLAIILLYFFTGNLKKYFKKDISEYDFYALEKELDDVKNASELLRKRFVSTIELLHQGISFRESDNTIFGSDRFITIMGLESNQFTTEEFESIIYKDDIIQYRSSLEKTTKRNPIYTLNYRIIIHDEIRWVKEVGKRISINKKIGYISLVSLVDIKQYPTTEIEVLNALKNEKNLYNEMQKCTREKTPYHLILIHLTNIPKINEKYGREVGDLMMGEYIKKMRYNFIKEDQSLYRIGGIDFALLIKDEKKFEFLNRALSGSGDLMNLKMVFGGITQTLYPNLGISAAPYEGVNPDKVLEQAKEALSVSLKDTTNSNYIFYDRI